MSYLEEHNINPTSLFPDSWDSEKKYEPYKKFYQGVQAEINGNASDAVKLYTDTINLNPDFIDAYKRRGRISYHKLDFRKAHLDIEQAFSLEKARGLYDVNKNDEIIGLHLFFDEHNAGCMHRILGKIYGSYGDTINSQEYMKRAEYIRHRYNRREKNENLKKHKRG